MAETTKNQQAHAALNNDIFNVAVPNHELVKLAYDSYLANNRSNGGRTKTRGLVSGGGKKPWKQKGTGRARFGSSRNPLWRGGGIAFGPTGNQNFVKRISTVQKRVALRQALTLANQAGKFIIAEPHTTGKTREIVTFLKDNNADVRRVLLVTDKKTDELIRATANIQSIELISSMYLTVFHILNADKIIVSPAALETIEEWLTKQPIDTKRTKVEAA